MTFGCSRRRRRMTFECWNERLSYALNHLKTFNLLFIFLSQRVPLSVATGKGKAERTIIYSIANGVVIGRF